MGHGELLSKVNDKEQLHKALGPQGGRQENTGVWLSVGEKAEGEKSEGQTEPTSPKAT